MLRKGGWSRGSCGLEYHRDCCISSLLVPECSFHVGFQRVSTYVRMTRGRIWRFFLGVFLSREPSTGNLKKRYTCLTCRQIGGQLFAHAVGEPGVTSQAPTCVRAQACFKRSLPSNNLQASCARNSRQITRAGNSGCQPSSSFIGVSPERYRCIANRCAK